MGEKDEYGSPVVGVLQFINKKEGDDAAFTADDQTRIQELGKTIGPLIGKAQAGARETKSSRLNMVDLAGSERAKKTNVAGNAMKEAAHINTSLMMLGSCIS